MPTKTAARADDGGVQTRHIIKRKKAKQKDVREKTFPNFILRTPSEGNKTGRSNDSLWRKESHIFDSGERERVEPGKFDTAAGKGA